MVLPRDGAFNSSPIWSPDSAKLLFRTFQKVVEFHQKKRRRRRKRTDSAVVYRTVQASGIPTNDALIDTDWSPDGKNILLPSKVRVPRSDVWVLPQQVIRRRSTS